ncbi:DUF5119 domain-containing protein [Parabacteroides bouchesdurhonensis]|uniref:DUF5119 domain-containing protein n=1 Tax=Parabacteroides bouchesdurhonensis TaxID=1936995 RepID=UPI000C85DC87|nr:DUF5119 domain-containing protein [Parabacteroides bouchesdurhonensis]
MGRQKYTQILGLAVALLFLAGAFSCVYRSTDEDWDKNGKVRLLLNWKTKSQPSGMEYYFYKDGSTLPVVRTGASSGYEGTLPAGKYQVAVCNPDGTNIDLDMDKGYESACAKAHPVSSLKSSVAHIAQPVNLYGTGKDELYVSGAEAVTTELYPCSLTKQIELNIKVVGMDNVKTITGKLNGVSPEIHIPTGKAHFDRIASMPFSPEQTAPGVYTTFLTLFGLVCENGKEELVDLLLTVTMNDGSSFTSSTDITDQVNDAFSQGFSTNIVLDLEVSPDSVDGINIKIVDWHQGTADAESKG